MTEIIRCLLILASLLFALPVIAANQWPAESNSEAVKLTGVDPDFNANNMSGAAWNPVTRTLWLANNSGRFCALIEDGAGSFKVAADSAGKKAKWSPGGDLESICQADYAKPIVYLLDENGWIHEYDVSGYGVVARSRSWDIRAQCPEINGAGPEGLTFVPDEWLKRQQFRRGKGDLYTSTNGMGGLMFVGHQAGGYIHVFDLNKAGSSYEYVGRYVTGQSETAGLEFDRATGNLWIWHNTGANYAEVTGLNSDASGAERRFHQIGEYKGPRSGNLEGFAFASADGWCFVADDDNANGEAIVWYRRFNPPKGGNPGMVNKQSVPANEGSSGISTNTIRQTEKLK